jgi:hypothetical protein
MKLGAKCSRTFSGGFAFLGLMVAAVPASAGVISPGTIGGAFCEATSAFVQSDDCVGQVTDPKNEANGNPTTLVSYLNQFQVGTVPATAPRTTVPGSIVDENDNPWGDVGQWLGISNQLNVDDGQLPGTSTDGFFTVTGDHLYSGDWTFDLGNLLIDYLVVTVKNGGGWSGYYYDFSDQNISSFTDTWDTLGITTGGPNPTPGPKVSHMYAAYILGDGNPDPDPNPVPLPGTLLLLGLGLASLGASRRRR